eukprot:891445-Rhodomonas_salina.1
MRTLRRPSHHARCVPKHSRISKHSRATSLHTHTPRTKTSAILRSGDARGRGRKRGRKWGNTVVPSWVPPSGKIPTVPPLFRNS